MCTAQPFIRVKAQADTHTLMHTGMINTHAVGLETKERGTERCGVEQRGSSAGLILPISAVCQLRGNKVTGVAKTQRRRLAAFSLASLQTLIFTASVFCLPRTTNLDLRLNKRKPEKASAFLSALRTILEGGTEIIVERGFEVMGPKRKDRSCSLSTVVIPNSLHQ